MAQRWIWQFQIFPPFGEYEEAEEWGKRGDGGWTMGGGLGDSENLYHGIL